MSPDVMEPPPQPAPAGAARDPAVDALEQRLGVPVVNPAVALAALTHKSFVNEHRSEALQDNERLEFLGDAVIDLAVSHRLMERFPDAREGDLSKIRAAVVDEAGLALMARELDLGPLLRLGRGEELTGGRQKSSLLADALEAVIAAVYLGGGLEPVLSVIERFLGDAFARAAAGTLDRDYKTQLQELVQSRLRTAPRYRIVAEHGPDHSKVFEVELDVRGEVIGRGTGRSKKDAEQAAAKLALDAMNERFAEVAPAEKSARAPPPETAPATEAVEPPAPPPEPAPPPVPEVPAPAPVPERIPLREGRKRKVKAATPHRSRSGGKAAVASGRRVVRKPAPRARAHKPARK